MIRRRNILRLILAGALAVAAVCAAPVQWFYWWTDSSHGFSSWSGFLNPQRTSVMASASYNAPDNIPRLCHVEVFGYPNVPGAAKVVYADYWLTNTLNASCSFGPADPNNWSYFIARVQVNVGAYGTIFADGTSH